MKSVFRRVINFAFTVLNDNVNEIIDKDVKLITLSQYIMLHNIHVDGQITSKLGYEKTNSIWLACIPAI